MDNDYQKYCEGRLAITLAGDIAMKRALQGSAPGWVRLRSRRELVAIHEAGHAVLADVIGFQVHRVFIIPVVGDGKRGFAGACVSSLSNENPLNGEAKPHPEKMVTDRRQTVQLCFVLALAAGSPSPGAVSWRAALAQYRVWRNRVRDLVEQNWRAIVDLAWELERREDLNRGEVAAILNPQIEGSMQ